MTSEAWCFFCLRPEHNEYLNSSYATQFKGRAGNITYLFLKMAELELCKHVLSFFI